MALPKNKKTILVVEDNLHIMNVYGRWLNSQGHVCFEANSYLSALRILEREHFHTTRTRGIDGAVIDWLIPECSADHCQLEYPLSQQRPKEKIIEAWFKGENYRDSRPIETIEKEIKARCCFGEVIAGIARKLYPEIPIILSSSGFEPSELTMASEKFKESKILLRDKGASYTINEIGKDLGL